jgi:hypothetical protein
MIQNNNKTAIMVTGIILRTVILFTFVCLFSISKTMAQDNPLPPWHGGSSNLIEGAPLVPGHGGSGNYVPGAPHYQVISLPAGWSGLSSYVLPQSPSIEAVFSGIEYDLIIAITDDAIYYPAYNINTIVEWNSFSAYKIKTNAAVELNMHGSLYSEKSLSLLEGWNLLPVISECPVDVEEFFAPLIGNLEIVKDIAGTGVYWPEVGVNTLGTINPGMAYYVLVSDDMEVSFGECNKNVVAETMTEFETLSGLVPWEVSKPTPSTHTLAIFKDAIAGFENGAFIGAFDVLGKCCGLIQVKGMANCLTVFGEDELTGAKDGFAIEEQITFKLFKPSTNEQFALTPEFDITMPDAGGVFKINGISLIRGFIVGALGTGNGFEHNVQLFPNPSIGEFTISGLLPGAELMITDAHGQLVYSAFPFSVENVQVNIGQFTPGVYIIAIRQSIETSFHKLILK